MELTAKILCEYFNEVISPRCKIDFKFDVGGKSEIQLLNEIQSFEEDENYSTKLDAFSIVWLCSFEELKRTDIWKAEKKRITSKLV